jgi:N-sulfoglucosamine sulfohydrolase
LHGRSFLNGAKNDRVFFSHQFHELTMYYPMRGMRTKQYKYLLNLFPELSFPFASDLFASDMWQSVRRAGPDATVGQRPVSTYLQRPAEELYDVLEDPLEANNLAALPAHRDTLTRMRAEVMRFRKETRDPWLINDDYK